LEVKFEFKPLKRVIKLVVVVVILIDSLPYNSNSVKFKTVAETTLFITIPIYK